MNYALLSFILLHYYYMCSEPLAPGHLMSLKTKRKKMVLLTHFKLDYDPVWCPDSPTADQWHWMVFICNFWQLTCDDSFGACKSWQCCGPWGMNVCELILWDSLLNAQTESTERPCLLKQCKCSISNIDQEWFIHTCMSLFDGSDEKARVG